MDNIQIKKSQREQKLISSVALQLLANNGTIVYLSPGQALPLDGKFVLIHGKMSGNKKTAFFKQTEDFSVTALEQSTLIIASLDFDIPDEMGVDDQLSLVDFLLNKVLRS